jgi:hypothetical protein
MVAAIVACLCVAGLPREFIPRPVVPERALSSLYWRAWEGLWQWLRSPQLDLGDADSGAWLASHPSLVAQYAKYARGALSPARILSHAYARQRPDGLIPDVRAAAPCAPLFSWSEWDSYRASGDCARLAQVRPALESFHRWLAGNQQGADGLYHAARESRAEASLELSCQMALDACCLSLIAAELADDAAATAFATEHAALAAAVNHHLWSEAERCYVEPGAVQGGPAGFWPLLAGVATGERADAVIAHLAALQHPWPHTPPSDTYVLVRGLLRAGRPGLAKTIALECLRRLPSQPAGLIPLAPAAMLVEAVLGFSLDAPASTLHWAPRLGARHGIEGLALGDCTVSVVCGARGPGRDYRICAQADRPFTLRVVTEFGRGTTWRGKRSLGPLKEGVTSVQVRAGAGEYRISGELRPDANPPAQPQQLSAVRSDHGALVQWQPCADEDLAGYHVYRSEDHGWRKVSAAPCIWASYVDGDSPARGCLYAVAAVDVAGNTSPMSAPAEMGAAGGRSSAPTRPW